MTRVERVKMLRERRIKGAKKDDDERRGERRRSYLKTHRKKLRSVGLETIEVAIARYEVIQRNSLVRCS